MKRGLIVLVIAMAAGVAAFCWMHASKSAGHHTVMMDALPELAWVKSELKPDDAQFAKISELHTAYRPQCEAMCARITAAQDKVDALIRMNPDITPELDQAIRAHMQIEAECRRAMLQHIFQTAKTLDRDKAERYLKEVLPLAMDSKPTGSRHEH
jgi:hypothetical protein